MAQIEAFGRPNRPSTPIKRVMEDAFAAEAEEEQIWKNQMNETQFREFQKFRGVRPHTRASAMANEHTKLTRSSMFSQPTDLFKMTQFKNVKSRVGAYHVQPAAKKPAASNIAPATAKL